MSALATAAVLAGASGCGDEPLYKPRHEPSDADIDTIVEQLQAAVNGRKPAAICGLYAYPSPHCARVWRNRLRRLQIPVDLHVRYVEGSCDGAPRATLRTRLASDRISTVTWIAGERSIIEVGIGRRRSGLTIPRYGSCEDMHDVGGDPSCDIAGKAGYEDAFRACNPPFAASDRHVESPMRLT